MQKICRFTVKFDVLTRRLMRAAPPTFCEDGATSLLLICPDAYRSITAPVLNEYSATLSIFAPIALSIALLYR